MHRINTPNHARFLTFSTYHRLNLFESASLCDAFKEQLSITKTRHKVLLYAWVIMPNHIHLLVREPITGNIEPFLRTLKTGFAKRMISELRKTNSPKLQTLIDPRGQARFWQPGGGYDRNILSDTDFIEKTGYIHMNPVRARLAHCPTDWAWSSARWWSGDQENQIECDQR